VLFLGLAGLHVVVIVLAFFIYPLIVERELSGTEAAMLSIKAAFANLWGVLAVVLLAVVFLMIGTLGCLIGSFFVVPLVFAMAAVAYRQVFPASDHRFKELRPDPEPWDDDDRNAPADTGIQTEPGTRRSDTNVKED
jgi:uncharacterized membrane protein